MDIDIRLNIPALVKLMDYSASGIGSVAGPMLVSWKARQEAKAKAIGAKGEVEAQRIVTEGQADTMKIIATAQANARSLLVSPDSNVQGQLDFAHTVTQRIQFQEEKRQSNIETVVRHAASELEDKHVEDHEPDHDCTARYFNDVQDVSTKETQRLYAKILAGEVEKPGSTSTKTLGILKDLDRPTAMLFGILCSACTSLFSEREQILDARVISLGGDATQNALSKFGLSFDNLNILSEHGLIIADYKSRFGFSICVGTFGINEKKEKVVFRVPFGFEDRYWVLRSKKPRKIGSEYRVSGVALTKSGRELLKVVESQPVAGYSQDLVAFFASEGFVMTEADSVVPQVRNADLSWTQAE